QHLAEGGRRSDDGVLVWPVLVEFLTTAVDLDPGPGHDVLDRRVGQRVDERRRAVGRDVLRLTDLEPARRFVDTEVGDRGWPETVDDPGDRSAVGRIEAVELRRAQPAPGRDDVVPGHRFHRGLELKGLRDAGAELPAHAADQDAHYVER